MIKIAPSLMCCDVGHLKEEIEKLEESEADLIHVDIMDGHFVPNFGLGPTIVRYLRRNSCLLIDTHLMIADPGKYIEMFVDAGSHIISIHAESCNNIIRQIQHIKKLGVKASVAINPGTSLCSVEYVLQELDMVLIMAVEPGFRGYPLIPVIPRKISQLRKMAERQKLTVDIEVDGGINLDTIPRVVEAGANILVVGSAVFDTGKSIKESIRIIRKVAGHNSK